MTYANKDVLEFYKELPFNYRESVEDHVNAVRQRKITDLYPVLRPYLKIRNLKVLEVGCGVGWLSNGLAFHHKCSVTAIDFNPVAIERAQAISKRLNNAANFGVADLFLYEPPEPADLVISLGVLHHTDNCIEGVKRVCRKFVRSGGHVFIGLYHEYGRRPFLDEFSRMRKQGASEEEMYNRFRTLDSRFTDETHLRSWFRDQVLHPHETTHSMKEISIVLKKCGMSLVASSINKFGPIHSEAELWEEEVTYQDLAMKRLAAGEYFPGYFLFLAQRNSD